MVEVVTRGGTSAPRLELSLSLGLFSLSAISHSIGSLMMTRGGLELVAITLVLVFGRGSERGVGLFNFCLLRRTGGDSSSSSLEISIY